jgi:hypothetical protein
MLVTHILVKERPKSLNLRDHKKGAKRPLNLKMKTFLVATQLLILAMMMMLMMEGVVLPMLEGLIVLNVVVLAEVVVMCLLLDLLGRQISPMQPKIKIMVNPLLNG